jgi:colanic acid/amylovoran biosynthesis protein
VKSPLFLLVGNAPYANRGCEAIVRGTTQILDAAFGDRTRYVAASFGRPEQIKTQAAQEACGRLRHEWLAPKGRASVDYLKFQVNRFLGVDADSCTVWLPPDAPQASAALQVGGDNYSLDYGYPRRFMGIDRQLARHGVPLVLWGASVGPFASDPAFERQMARHLSRFCLITVREPRSYRYLRQLDLTNVVQVADPAFLMQPQPVADLALPSAFVGINLSPLMADAATGGDLERWRQLCASALLRLVSRCGLPIVLIPHVASPVAERDDRDFLRSLARTVNAPDRITLLEPELNAAQLKWVIGKALCFVGARTHSTIAALSMGVPTLSLAYSIKAWGINEDVFGHARYCLASQSLRDENLFTQRVIELVHQHVDVRRQIEWVLPTLKAKAMTAGDALREIIHAQN